MIVVHPNAPVYDEYSAVLILGTMPSPASRQAGFYYMHPQNRFWRVIGDVAGEAAPGDVEGRKAFALRHGIALWDVLFSCEIAGASDASIKNPVANDIGKVLSAAPIGAVYCTGKRAHALYMRLCHPHTGMEAVCLPSTSPANCAVEYEALLKAYGAIRQWLRP